MCDLSTVKNRVSHLFLSSLPLYTLLLPLPSSFLPSVMLAFADLSPFLLLQREKGASVSTETMYARNFAFIEHIAATQMVAVRLLSFRSSCKL